MQIQIVIFEVVGFTLFQLVSCVGISGWPQLLSVDVVWFHRRPAESSLSLLCFP